MSDINQAFNDLQFIASRVSGLIALAPMLQDCESLDQFRQSLEKRADDAKQSIADAETRLADLQAQAQAVQEQIGRLQTSLAQIRQAAADEALGLVQAGHEQAAAIAAQAESDARKQVDDARRLGDSIHQDALDESASIIAGAASHRQERDALAQEIADLTAARDAIRAQLSKVGVA